MLDLIRKTAVFIRADVCSANSIRTAEVLESLIDGRLAEDAAVSEISACLNCESRIKYCVPNNATAFVVFSLKALNKALSRNDFGLAYDIADILQALPEKEYLKDKKAVSLFNKTYIRKFNKKHLSHLPEIV